MLDATSSSKRYPNPVVLPCLCMVKLALKLPKLQRSLHHTATLTKAQRQSSSFSFKASTSVWIFAVLSLRTT